MTTTVNLRRLLDRKQWEMCNFAPTSSAVGSFVVSSNLDSTQFFVVSNTVVYMYDPMEDGWLLLPSPALAGTFGAGASGCRHPHGPRGFPTAGTTTTLTTNLNFQRNLKGYKVRIIAGPAAGEERVIKSNTTGSNSVITFETAFGSTLTTASEFIMFTGRLWLVGAGTLASGSFKYYDWATNAWSTMSITNLPATIGTDGRLIGTPGYLTDFVPQTTASSATSTTLVKTSAGWTVNTWSNYQVRIVSGTGAGQFRVITSNTSDTLTVPAWTTTPDATSQFVIEGNDDALFYLGNNAVTMYKYSISGNTWSTVSPGVARAAAPVAGMSAQWVWAVTDADWTSTTNAQNGKFIYSWRGNGAILDRYNIASNAWENDIAHSPKAETMSSGTGYCYAKDYIYSMLPGGRLLQYNVAKSQMEPCSQLWYTQGTTVIGDRLFDATYVDGATTIRWLYYITATQTTLFRMLVI